MGVFSWAENSKGMSGQTTFSWATNVRKEPVTTIMENRFGAVTGDP